MTHESLRVIGLTPSNQDAFTVQHNFFKGTLDEHPITKRSQRKRRKLTIEQQLRQPKTLFAFVPMAFDDSRRAPVIVQSVENW